MQRLSGAGRNPGTGRRLNQGDFEGARRASANAKTWCWVATALAIIGALWSIYFFSTGGMAEYQQMMEQIQQAQ